MYICKTEDSKTLAGFAKLVLDKAYNFDIATSSSKIKPGGAGSLITYLFLGAVDFIACYFNGNTIFSSSSLLENCNFSG